MSDPSSDRLREPALGPARGWQWAIRAAVALPVLLAVLRALWTGWFPVGDSALLAVRAYDVGTTHHPWLGSWTSASLTLGVDVNNPGPLYPDVLAPFMWTIGRWFGIGPAIAVGVGVLNLGAMALTAWIGHRMGGWRTERWALLTAAALAWAMGSELLIDIWQPHALLLPFACLLWLTTSLLAGSWRLLPLWVGLVSLVVQTHVGYVYVLIVLSLTVGGIGLAELRRRRTALRDVMTNTPMRWAVVVFAVAWLQPLLEQVFGSGQGNLARLASNAGGSDLTIGAATAVKLVAQVVALPPWWMRWGFESSVPSTPLTTGPGGTQLIVPGLPGGVVAVLAVAAVVAVLVALWRHAHRRDLGQPSAALLVALVGVVTAVVTLSFQTLSPVGLGSHHVRWLWVLSLFVQIAVGWALVELGWLRLSSRQVTVVLGALIVGFSLANIPKQAHDLGPTIDRAANETLERTFDDLTSFDPGGAVLYDTSNLRPFEPWSGALKMRLREVGVEFRVADEGFVRQLGESRRADGGEVTTFRQIERSAALRYDGPGCVVSLASPFDQADEAVIDAQIANAVDDLAAGRATLDLDGLEPDLTARFEEAQSGDVDEAFVLVADGVLAFLGRDGRIVSSTPAIDAVVADADRIARRVNGTLLVIADPPVGCPE